MKLIQIMAVLILLMVAYRAIKKHLKKPKQSKTQSFKVAPKDFDLEYYISNQTLCIAKNQQKGNYDLFVRLGRTGLPRFEMHVVAQNAGEALAKAVKQLELDVI